MTKKVFNMAGGKHSAMAYAAFENRMFGGSIKASTDSFVVSAGSGMNANISPGDALIDTGSNYGRRVQSDAVETVAVAAASGSFNRIDSVVAYIDMNVTPSTGVTDNTNDILKFASVAGTAASTPSAPSGAAIQSAIGAGNPYMILANILVPQSASNLSGATFTNQARVASTLDVPTLSDIINGGMQVAQRVTAPNLSASYQYGAVDRFAAKGAGTAVSAGTIGQSTSPNCGSTGFSLKLAGVTLTGTGKVYLRYRMEAKDALRYKNQPASVGFKMYHDVGSSIPVLVTLRKPTSSDNYTSTTSIVSTSTQSVPSGVETALKFNNVNNGSIGDVSNGLEIEVEVQCGAITTKNFEFADFQLTRETTAPTFKPRTFEQELHSCQRYYETSYPYGTAPGATYPDIYYNSAGVRDNGGGNAFLEGKGYFKARKRAAPTMRWYNPRTGAGTTHWAAGGVTGTNYTSMTVNLGFETYCYFANSTTGGDFHIGSCWVADAEL